MQSRVGYKKSKTEIYTGGERKRQNMQENTPQKNVCRENENVIYILMLQRINAMRKTCVIRDLNNKYKLVISL